MYSLDTYKPRDLHTRITDTERILSHTGCPPYKNLYNEIISSSYTRSNYDFGQYYKGCTCPTIETTLDSDSDDMYSSYNKTSSCNNECSGYFMSEEYIVDKEVDNLISKYISDVHDVVREEKYDTVIAYYKHNLITSHIGKYIIDTYVSQTRIALEIIRNSNIDVLLSDIYSTLLECSTFETYGKTNTMNLSVTTLMIDY